MESFEKILSSIEPVQAPPFLLTRIEQKIVQERKNSFHMKLVYSGVSFACFMLVLNLYSLSTLEQNSQPSVSIETDFGLTQNYYLYGE